MDLIINVSHHLPNNTIILIDSRHEAVLALQKLSTIVNKNISLTTGIQFFKAYQDSDKRIEEQRLKIESSVNSLKAMTMYSIATFNN